MSSWAFPAKASKLMVQLRPKLGDIFAFGATDQCCRCPLAHVHDQDTVVSSSVTEVLPNEQQHSMPCRNHKSRYHVLDLPATPSWWTLSLLLKSAGCAEGFRLFAVPGFGASTSFENKNPSIGGLQICDSAALEHSVWCS